jgi:hypothetical protein
MGYAERNVDGDWWVRFAEVLGVEEICARGFQWDRVLFESSQCRCGQDIRGGEGAVLPTKNGTCTDFMTII